VDPAQGSEETLESVLATQREEILAQVVQAVEALDGSLDSALAGQLLDGFVAELEQAATGAFLAALNRVLRQVTVTASDIASGHIAAMQNVVSTLRCAMLSYLDGERRARAEDLWQQARVTIAVMVERAKAREAEQAQAQAQTLRNIGLTLTTASDVAELVQMLAESLPQFEISSVYLALYESPQPYQYPQPAPERSWLMLAYTAAAPDSQGGGVPAEGLRFPSRELLPQGMWPDRRYSYVAEPLYFREDQIGFALFEVGQQRDGSVYNTLQGEVSSALQGVLLRDQAERRAVQVQTAAEVSRAASSILMPETLIEQMVGLVHERFDLYYVGLFLVDQTGEWTGEAGKWAVLRSGTGEAGRQMVAQGHRLTVGGESMVGVCIADGEARIALDVGAEAVRFENPLLPDTRSELALPLISQGETIGALTIQSTEVAAFRREDIAVFQTMADQLANAIQNARLVDRMEAALKETEATQRRYIQQSWSEYPTIKVDFGYKRPGVESETMWSQAQRAVSDRRAVVESRDGETEQSALVVPVMVRDQPIGVLGFEAERRGGWSETDVALAESLAEQLGLAAENLRLLDETQRRAAREQLTGRATARMRETLDLETVLKTAVDEIQRALGLEKVAIRLMVGDSEPQSAVLEEE
jgi:GAF domain-containing protein